jgi:hypothetical protein
VTLTDKNTNFSLLKHLDSPWISWVMAFMAFTWSTALAVVQCGGPGELDVDSWAVKVTNSYPYRIPFAELFQNPSLWKGPVVPTIYHISYFIYPSVYSPLAVNIISFAIAAGVLHRLFLRMGGHPFAAASATIVWIYYPPFRFIYSMYYAEPLVSLLSTIVLLCVLKKPQKSFYIGLLAGILLLGRPPFLIIIASIPMIFFLKKMRKEAIMFIIGTSITFLPWGIRNYFTTGTFVPFTVEGGQTLFHGSYLPLDNIKWQEFKEDPRVSVLEMAAPEDPVGRMKYLSGLAKKQILADPLGQAVHCVRKGMRFWMDVPGGSFVPHRNTGTAACIFLPFMLVGAIRNRRFSLVQWCVIWILGLWAMHAIVFGFLRYCYPIFPLAMFVAASAIWPMQNNGPNLQQIRKE